MAKKKPRPRYYSTTIDAQRSALEIGDLVGAYGARSFGWRANPETREPISVYFVVPVDGIGDVPVEIEAKVDAIKKRLYPPRKGGGGPTEPTKRERSLNVAWRQVHAYVEMMLEMVENGLKPFHEAFMSDVVIFDGSENRRLGDVYRDRGGRLLPAGKVIDVDAEIVE